MNTNTQLYAYFEKRWDNFLKRNPEMSDYLGALAQKRFPNIREEEFMNSDDIKRLFLSYEHDALDLKRNPTRLAKMMDWSSSAFTTLALPLTLPLAIPLFLMAYKKQDETLRDSFHRAFIETYFPAEAELEAQLKKGAALYAKDQAMAAEFGFEKPPLVRAYRPR